MQKVIIDCDPGIDDTLALLFALKHPEIDIQAITVVAGNVDVDKGVHNVVKLQKFLETDVATYRGFTSGTYINAEDTHGKNGIGNVYLSLDNNLMGKVKSRETMLNKITDIVDDNPNEVTMICLGPLTNLGHIMNYDSEFISNVKEIIIMGGSFRTHGNCSPVCEYNFWCDPKSANYVFTEASYSNKLRVVSLDVTRKIVLNKQRLDKIHLFSPKIGNLVASITEYYMDFHKYQEGINGCVINDPLVLVDFVEGIIQYDEYFAKIVDSANADVAGQMLVDVGGFYHKMPNIRLSTNVDVERFWDIFTATITK